MAATIKVLKSELLSAMQMVAGVVSDKSTIPAFTTILFEVTESKITLTGTNQEIQISTSITPVEVSEEIVFCMDKSIMQVLKALPEQPVTLNVSKEKSATSQVWNVIIKMVHSRGSIEVPGFDPEGFAKLPVKEGVTFEIPADKLKRGFEKTKKFAHSDKAAPAACSVYLDITPEDITFVATNNIVVSVFRDKSLVGIQAESIIMPIEGVNLLCAILPSKDIPVVMIATQGSIIVDYSGTIIAMRTPEKKYANYKSIIPKQEAPINIRYESKLLELAIERLLAVASDIAPIIRIDASMAGIFMRIEDTAFSKSAVESLETICDSEIAIGVNGLKIQDILSLIDGTAILKFTDPRKVIIVTPEIDEENTEYKSLLMPISL